MQNCAQTVKQVSSHLIDWPEKLQIKQDIKLFNDVLDALGPDPKFVETKPKQLENM